MQHAVPETEIARRFAETTLGGAPVAFENYAGLLRDVITHSVNMSSPRCLAHMTGAVPAFVVPLMEVVTSLNQNLVRRDASRVMSIVERQVVAMLHRVVFQCGDPFYQAHAQADKRSLGFFTSGGTLSNLAGLWAARQRAFPTDGEFKGVESSGLAAALAYHHWDRAVILCSRLVHYSIGKAAALLGMGDAGVMKLDVDSRQRLDLRSLEHALAECERKRWRVIAVVGIAGNTDTGAIDQLPQMAELVQGSGTHFHVDAAWGGCWLFSEALRPRLAGIERADSVTIDLHKQFHLPVSSSLLLLRDPDKAYDLRQRANYILQEDSRDLGEFSIEGSRSAASLLAHAALHLVGPSLLGQWTDTTLDSAKLMASLIRESPEFELLLEPETNIVLYRYVTPALRTRALTHREEEWLNALNTEIHRSQLESGRTLVSRTKVDGMGAADAGPTVALRAVFGNPRTSIEDIRAVLQDQVSIATALTVHSMHDVHRA